MRAMNVAELWSECQRLEREARQSLRLAMILCAVATLGGGALLGLFFLAEEKLEENLPLGFVIAGGALLSLVGAIVVMVLANRKLRRMADVRDARRQIAREMTGLVGDRRAGQDGEPARSSERSRGTS
jgi:hypothetical protein